jgi:hypothetical protein
MIPSAVGLNAMLRLALVGHTSPEFVNDADRVGQVAKLLGLPHSEVLENLSSLIENLNKRRIDPLKSVHQANYESLKRKGFGGESV